MMSNVSRSAGRFALACVIALALVVLLDGVWHHALAQNPFGGPRAAPEPKAAGLIGWILEKQSQFYKQISATIRAAKSDGSAVWTLLAISFVYGVFHAAGPGHGKAVISSYVIANGESARRGIVLAFVSAMFQALVAVVIVGIGAWLLNVTAKTMCSAERVIEIASYGLIAVLGVRLVWTKGAGLLRELRQGRGEELVLAPVVAGHAPHDHHGHDHHHDHHHHDHAHHQVAHAHDGHVHHNHNPAHGAPGHVHDAHCCHAHGPTPDQLAGPGGWARGLSAIVAVGLRPCSGAILVLVFALAQGLFWTGAAAAFLMGLGTAITVAAIAVFAISAKNMALRIGGGASGYGALLVRGLEFGAAALVLLFGVGLLLGYVSAERVTCF